MGVEYHLLDQFAGESFELGKGEWSRLSPGNESAAVLYALDLVPIAYSAAITAELVSFYATHPAAVVMSEDEYYDFSERRPIKQVGSRYK